MGIPVFFGITLIIVFLIQYGTHKSTAAEKARRERFWAREREANTTRKKDISNLDFITIPECLSSPSGSVSEEITETEKAIAELSEKKIVNFSGKSNTDLKLEYGAANFPFLSEYDANYIKLVQLIQKYSKLLIKEGYNEKATDILRFGISVAPEVKSLSKLLAEFS